MAPASKAPPGVNASYGHPVQVGGSPGDLGRDGMIYGDPRDIFRAAENPKMITILGQQDTGGGNSLGGKRAAGGGGSGKTLLGA